MKIPVALEILCQIAFQNSHYPTEGQGEGFATPSPVIVFSPLATDILTSRKLIVWIWFIHWWGLPPSHIDLLHRHDAVKSGVMCETSKWSLASLKTDTGQPGWSHRYAVHVEGQGCKPHALWQEGCGGTEWWHRSGRRAETQGPGSMWSVAIHMPDVRECPGRS